MFDRHDLQMKHLAERGDKFFRLLAAAVKSLASYM